MSELPVRALLVAPRRRVHGGRRRPGERAQDAPHADRPRSPEPAHEADYQWLTRVGGAAALSFIDGRLPYLFGRGTCRLRRRVFGDGPARRLLLTPSLTVHPHCRFAGRGDRKAITRRPPRPPTKLSNSVAPDPAGAACADLHERPSASWNRLLRPLEARCQVLAGTRSASFAAWPRTSASVPRATSARLRPSFRTVRPLPSQSASTTTRQTRSLPYQFQVAPSGPPERQARSDSPAYRLVGAAAVENLDPAHIS